MGRAGYTCTVRFELGRLWQSRVVQNVTVRFQRPLKNARIVGTPLRLKRSREQPLLQSLILKSDVPTAPKNRSILQAPRVGRGDATSVEKLLGFRPQMGKTPRLNQACPPQNPCRETEELMHQLKRVLALSAVSRLELAQSVVHIAKESLVAKTAQPARNPSRPTRQFVRIAILRSLLKFKEPERNPRVKSSCPPILPRAPLSPLSCRSSFVFSYLSDTSTWDKPLKESFGF